MKQENEEKKEYLRSYGKSVRKIRTITEEIDTLRNSKMFPSVVIDDMPHARACNDLSGYAAKVDELIEKLITERYRRISRYKDILESDEKQILRLRYLHEMKWDEIQDSGLINYERANIFRLHGRALAHFKIKKKENQDENIH